MPPERRQKTNSLTFNCFNLMRKNISEQIRIKNEITVKLTTVNNNLMRIKVNAS